MSKKLSIFPFLKTFIRRYPIKSKRLFEILPGFVSWNLILFPIWGSFAIPHLVAYYIITFDIYWLYKSLTTAVMIVIGHFRLQANQIYDWMGDVKLFPDWRNIRHLIIIPTYKEPIHTLDAAIASLKNQTFPAKNIDVCVSFEVREGPDAKQKAKVLKEKYTEFFGNFFITHHPDLPGEVKGKSSNSAWAGKYAYKKLIKEQKHDLDYYTITSQDADSVFHPNYFAVLAYKFLDHPRRYHLFFQPVIHFFNNIWRVPTLIRIFNSSSSIAKTGLILRRDRLVNFSTYSAAWKMLHQIGYWDVDVIPEDYRVFYKAFFALDGQVEVEPIFLPVYQDAAESSTWMKTMSNQYEQVKRWAWGASDDQYLIKQWILADNIPFWEKTTRVAKTLIDHFLWPVYWFAITIGALLPPLLNPEFARTVMGKTLPQVSSGLLSICLIAFLLGMIVDYHERPAIPKGQSKFKRFLLPFEYLLFPVVNFFFNAIPSLDAHTRLILGRYIEYRVTEKV